MADENASGAGAAPAGASESTNEASVDWAGLNAGATPGEDEGDDDELETPLNPDGSEADEPADPPPSPKTGENPPPEVPAPVTPPEPDQTPEQIAAARAKVEKDFAEWEQAQIATLTKQYAFNEDDATRLQTEPELVLPELAARMQMNVMKQVLETVSRMVPQMVQPELQRSSTEAKATEFFYGVNSDLDPKMHHDKVLEAGKLFRKMNPKATPDEAAKGIGEIVRAAAGIKTQPKAAAPVPKAKPHRPVAAGGRGSAAAKAPAEKTMWADLADDE